MFVTPPHLLATLPTNVCDVHKVGGVTTVASLWGAHTQLLLYQVVRELEGESLLRTSCPYQSSGFDMLGGWGHIYIDTDTKIDVVDALPPHWHRPSLPFVLWVP